MKKTTPKRRKHSEVMFAVHCTYHGFIRFNRDRIKLRTACKYCKIVKVRIQEI